MSGIPPVQLSAGKAAQASTPSRADSRKTQGISPVRRADSIGQAAARGRPEGAAAAVDTAPSVASDAAKDQEGSEIWGTQHLTEAWLPSGNTSMKHRQTGGPASIRPTSADEGWQRWLRTVAATQHTDDAKVAALGWLNKHRKPVARGPAEDKGEATSDDEDEEALRLVAEGKRDELAQWWLDKYQARKAVAPAPAAAMELLSRQRGRQEARQEEEDNARVAVQSWLCRLSEKKAPPEADLARALMQMKLPCHSPDGEAVPSAGDADRTAPSAPQSAPSLQRGALKADFKRLLERVKPQAHPAPSKSV